jgi:ABC-type thiamin/hydroxymethylpyrimidine transport system permease subunit
MGMEPEVRDFLQRVVWSIGIGLLYLIINSTIGIAGGWFFFADKPTLGNYIFYVWFIATTVGLVVLMVKWWKKKFPHG